LIRVQMPAPKWIKREIKTPYWKNPVAWLNTGVPHLVVEVKSKKELMAHTEEAVQMRSWEGLGKAGANVTFVNFDSETKLHAVTFERGVEDYTLACGTGAVAAAMFSMEKNKTKSCSVTMPGGDLMIEQDGQQIFMEGEARRVADIKAYDSF
jgi:diaminopimelate epimerase